MSGRAVVGTARTQNYWSTYYGHHLCYALNSCLNLNLIAMTKRHQAGTHARQGPPYLQLSEEEQLRLIEQTGILKEIPVSGQKHEAGSTLARASVDDDEDYPLAEEIFAATTLLIPMSFLLLMMYMWVFTSRRSRIVN